MASSLLVSKVLDDRTAIQPEQKLWRAVLNQALEDVFGYSAIHICEYEKRDVENFFSKRSEEFDQLCEDAGVNPSQLWRKIQRLKMVRVGFLKPSKKEMNTLNLLNASKRKRQQYMDNHWRSNVW